MVGVVLERLRGVERRIDVDELDLAEVFRGQLGHGRKRSERIAGVADDEQVLVSCCRAGWLSDGLDDLDALS